MQGFFGQQQCHAAEGHYARHTYSKLHYLQDDGAVVGSHALSVRVCQIDRARLSASNLKLARIKSSYREDGISKSRFYRQNELST
eukprot:scaffold89050_cov35-Prasinocladus_malaysianus.AAC.1